MALYDDVMSPASLGLFGLAGGLLEAGGPSKMPTSVGQGLNRGMLQGVGLAHQAEKMKLLQAEEKRRQEYMLMQSEAMKRDAEDKQRQQAALAALGSDPRMAPYLSILGVDPKTAIQRAFPEAKPPRTQADATGVLRYVDGPQAGQAVQGFDTPKAPEGFRVVNGNLEPIPEYWNQKQKVAEAGAARTTIENYPNPIPVVGPDGKPQMVQFGKRGDIRQTPFSPYEAQTSTDVERVAAGYASRMLESEKVLKEVGPLGDRTAGTDLARAVPWVGKYAERSAMSPQQQQVRQAQEDWVRAKLRKESGAVIADEEMAREIETYFPQVGDKPEVVEQKARARQTAIEAMTKSAGRAAQKPDDTKVTPKSKQFKLDDGSSIIGILEPSTGKYYVIRRGQKFYIEDN